MAIVRPIDRSVHTEDPILTYGTRKGIQIDFRGVVQDVPAGSLWVPGTNKKYYPLYPIAVVASESSNVYTMDSATQAGHFDPTDSDTNEQWLTANSGAQTVTFFDQSANLTLDGITQTSAGAMATETEVVSSVSGADLTTVAAFSTAPAADDVFFPGGCVSANIMTEAVYVPIEITVEKCESLQSDFQVEAYGQGTELSYTRLPASISDLVTASVVPSDGTRNIKIDLDR